MTIFLCLMAAWAIHGAGLGGKANDSTAWALALIIALRTVLALGLATLAVYTWSQP